MQDGRGVALAQGAYYVASGVLPLVSMRAFEAVTGPKEDDWLVRTVGLLVAAIGLALLLAARRGRVTEDLARVARWSAVALGGIDVYYSLRGRISKVYLADAAVEAALVAGWRRARRAA